MHARRWELECCELAFNYVKVNLYKLTGDVTVSENEDRIVNHVLNKHGELVNITKELEVITQLLGMRMVKGGVVRRANQLTK
jgi:hypothetical protein